MDSARTKFKFSREPSYLNLGTGRYLGRGGILVP
eukprot:SAG31_NODE_41655_length_275_cov_0.585227_1_plen_33_part_10